MYDPGPKDTLPEQEPAKAPPKKAPLLLLIAALLALPVTANTVREREPSPPDGVIVRPDGVWLMPCTATPRTMRCPRGVVCLYIQDGPDGWPTGTARPDCLVGVQADTTREVVRPVAKPTVIYDALAGHCLLDEERCTEVAQDTCRQAAGLPPGTKVRLVKKNFEMGKVCSWTCPDGTSFECSADTRPEPKPPEQALTP